MNIQKFDRYKQNLMIINDKVYSYETHVATIEYPNLIVPAWYSVTTSKHINYVATELNLDVIKGYE
jgi:hypothetical protein